MLVMLGVAVKPSSSAGWNWQRIASSAFPGFPKDRKRRRRFPIFGQLKFKIRAIARADPTL
jgi:hypothetical protein